MRIVDCGMRIEKEKIKFEIRNSKSEMIKGAHNA